MFKQTRIDEFYKSTSRQQATKKIEINSASVTSHNDNGKKRKKFPKDAPKRIKSNESFSDDTEDVKIEYQVNSTLNYEEEHIERTISLSSVNSVGSVASAYCEIVYDNTGGLSQEDHNDATLLFQDDDIVDGGINVMPIEDDIDTSFINKSKDNMLNNNETDLRRAENETEYNVGVLRTPNKEQASFDGRMSPEIGSSSSSFRLKRSKYSPRKPSGKSPRKQITESLRNQFVNIDIAKIVIEHMNLAKQGAIPLNDYNLEEIYSMGAFNYRYGQINTEASMHYQLDNVNLPRDLNAKVLIGSILAVLSKPFNCGYFEENELDFLYSILTLPEKGQMLLARMIKRKRGWHREHAINYPEISSDLKDVFKILESQSICSSKIEGEDLSVILDLLQAEELRQLCKNMKINYKGKKEVNIEELTKLSKRKSLFPGMRSPSSVLYDCIYDILDYCVYVTDRTWNTIDIIMTLLLPEENPQSSMSDIFLKLCDVYLGNIEFPKIIENPFPIFSSRWHLLCYVEIKSILSKTLTSIVKKNWEKVQFYGEQAMKTLPNLLKTESQRLENSMLPMHVRKFMPGYVWLKILSKSIDAFKRKKDMNRIEKILIFLIEQNCHMQTYKGKWYCELALVKMHHHKDIDSSALVTITALNCEHISQVDKIDLLQRAKQILNRKKGVEKETKIQMKKVLNDHCHLMSTFDMQAVISGSVMPKNSQNGKSIWLIESNDQGDSYGTVETVALYYYKEQQNFSHGLHCEGNLPILLFTTLFWEELYEIQVPGAFTSPYGTAPADLYTKYFHNHRKVEIDTKLRTVHSFNADPAAFSTWMEARFETYRQYQSLMPTNLLKHNIYMKEIVYCLGVSGVIGICKRMLENFKLWSAGFPDLILWNYDTRQHKIVEVKGPGDVLSTKQELWLKYLSELGLNVEVCLVKDRRGLNK